MDGAPGRLLAVAAGGALGSVLRYLTATAALRALGLDFPYGTLLVNLAGSFAIGVVQQAAAASLVPESLRMFLAVGVLGGFTTYSAFSYETIRLLEVGAWGRAALNVAGTTAGCLAFCFLGIALTRAVAGR